MDKEALINGYFEGSLDTTQLEEVELLLASDAGFKTEFEFQKELQLALKKEKRRDLKDLFNALAEEESKPKSKVFQLRPWLVAASLALLAGLAYWLFLLNTPDLNTDQLYAANFSPYDNVVHPIERGNQLEDLKTKAFTSYEEKDYITALKLFKELQTKQNDDYITFYEAIVLMQLNKHLEAIPLLQDYRDKNGQLKDRATWYLALSYLKTDEVKRCKEELRQLVQESGFKLDSAKELLQQLD